MSQNARKEIEELKRRIMHHDYMYYVLSQPKIADKEYDHLMLKLKTLEDQYPQFKSDDSPTLRVRGGILPGLKTVRHRQKMLSLENTYSFDELKDWDKRVHKGLSPSDKAQYVVELKIDGLSANLTYEKGKLRLGATRGDGEIGEDVTQNIKTIRAVPLSLIGSDIPELIEIRAEVYMDKEDLRMLNRERKNSGEALFANPRNAASGSLKLLDPNIVAKRRLNFFAHSLGEYKGRDILSQWEYLNRLKEWGIRTNPNSKLCQDLEEAIRYCRHWQERREGLDYDIDGMVIKVNSLAQQRKLGFTLKSPRWAISYKFPARQATTEVVGINIKVGRTGVITPAAELKPVECGGVVIRNATLHNFDEIKRLDIRIGDRVLIERAGDVIPKVVKVTERKGKRAFSLPKSCPVCFGKVVKEKEEDVAYRCINPSCPAQLERGLLHFASRQAMDIEGMGEAVVSQLVQKKIVRSFADVYTLKTQDLLSLDLFKEKKVSNLLSAIERSKARSLWRLIYALGIRHVGEKAAYLLAQHFKVMDNLARAKKGDFEAIYEVGPVIAKSVVDYFSQPETKKMIDGLRRAGLNFKEEVVKPQATPFSGKSVVFTGELKDYSRSQAEELLRRAGGSASSVVSRATGFVVAGDNAGTKLVKAKKLGIKIIGEKEFKEMIK